MIEYRDLNNFDVFSVAVIVFMIVSMAVTFLYIRELWMRSERTELTLKKAISELHEIPNER